MLDCGRFFGHLPSTLIDLNGSMSAFGVLLSVDNEALIEWANEYD
jgi:hypothetical protein